MIRRTKGNAASPTNDAAHDLDHVGGTPALNFVNTLRADAGVPMETLHSDRDVRVWMKSMGFAEPRLAGPLQSGALLEAARELRGLVLAILERKRAGKRVDLKAFNEYLSRSESHLVLADQQGAFTVRREFRAASAEQFLSPVADAIAEFVAGADFSLVRRCEGSGCVLWFADRPSGRPRRFCTENTCGVRARVAAHRARMAQVEGV